MACHVLEICKTSNNFLFKLYVFYILQAVCELLFLQKFYGLSRTMNGEFFVRVLHTSSDAVPSSAKEI